MLSRWQLERITRVLREGGVIAYPTESVYGLGCDPQNEDALRRILAIKRRPANKGLIILVNDIHQALPYLQPLSQAQIEQLNQPQSRATSWLLPCHLSVSTLLRGQFHSLAVRITRHPIARAIIDASGKPLVSTSCNLAGKPEMLQTSEVRSRMGARVDLVVAGQCGKEQPSRIVEFSSGRVIRE